MTSGDRNGCGSGRVIWRRFPVSFGRDGESYSFANFAGDPLELPAGGDDSGVMDGSKVNWSETYVTTPFDTEDLKTSANAQVTMISLSTGERPT